MWPNRRLIDLFKTEFPIVLAPMAGVMDAELVIAVAQGGGLGSLPSAMLSPEKAREQVNIIRAARLRAGEHEFLLPHTGRAHGRGGGALEAAPRGLLQ
ncbi:NAD(P)H-dependent flavin oxidoreductase YrpB (nitropropane dioxygenase family) [Bradyrhizobium sp. GM0.4]